MSEKDQGTSGASDIFTGLPGLFAKQYEIPSTDHDVVRLLRRYEEEFSKVAAKWLGRFSQACREEYIARLGDSTARELVARAMTDGQHDVPWHVAPRRPPQIHTLVEPVSFVAAQICEQRQAVDGAIQQELVVAKAEQADQQLPHYQRSVTKVQRFLLTPIFLMGLTAITTVARRVNRWPATGDALSDQAVPFFAVAVAILGLVTGMVLATPGGRSALDQVWSSWRPRRLAFMVGGLSAALGLLCATGGLWDRDPVDWVQLCLAMVVWALLGAVGFGLVHASVVFTQSPEVGREIADVWSRRHSQEASKREKQAAAAAAVVRPLHDALLRQATTRALVLATHYYRVNLLERRATRDGTLETFIEEDIESIRAAIGQLSKPPCVCDLASLPPWEPPAEP